MLANDQPADPDQPGHFQSSFRLLRSAVISSSIVLAFLAAFLNGTGLLSWLNGFGDSGSGLPNWHDTLILALGAWLSLVVLTSLMIVLGRLSRRNAGD